VMAKHPAGMPTRTAWRLPAVYRRGEATIAQTIACFHMGATFVASRGARM
jgi:hypothetical protein